MTEAAFVTAPSADVARLRPYVAGLAVEWLRSTPRARHRSIEGSLAFVDISGFTALTERLAARGKVGAEELSDLLDATFVTLLEQAYGYGGSLVKWGGDAVLLLFEGEDHAALACRASSELRRTMRRVGRLRTSVGVVQLKMSVGISSGAFDFFLVGNLHRELLVTGPAASRAAEMEQIAEAGQVVISPATAELLPPRCVGEAAGTGFLLRAAPGVDQRSRYRPPSGEVDLRLLLDPSLAQHLLSEVGDGEHRQVAVGFIEVFGVDDLIGRQGPAAVSVALHELLSIVQNACARHRVTFWETDISRNGFKIMLTAGAPASSGRDEEALLRAARAVLDAPAGPLQVRIGVNCGRVFTGAFGPPFRRTWSAKGDAINLAARVMGKAGDGELLATQQLIDRADVQVEAEALPAFLVKGKQQPVHAARVRQVLTRRSAGAVHDLVGRDGELQYLTAAAAAARAGAGTSVAVLGEAGIGKSCLVDAFSEAVAETAAVVRAFADPYEVSTPYAAVRRLLRGSLGIEPEATADEVLDVLRPALPSEDAGMLPLLAFPFGVDLPATESTAALAEEFRGARTRRLVVELLSERVVHPTVLVLDDVQHADTASVALLEAIAAEAARHPWLLVLVGRTASTGQVAGELALRPMAPVDAHELALSLPGANRLPPHVLGSILQRAEGNPLFLRELVDTCVRSGDADVSGSLEELLVAQVDNLPPVLRRLLRAAAVLGTRFSAGTLEQLLAATPSDADWSALDRFLARHDDGTVRFRTALARDVAYEGLPFRRRVELHARVADLLAAEARADGMDRSDVLSLHCFAAGQYAEAWEHSRAAAAQAQRVFANVEALAFLHRARSAARLVPAIDRRELAQLMETIGDVSMRLVDLDGASAAYRRARRTAPPEDVPLRARLALGAGLAATRAGLHAQTVRWFATADREAATAAGSEELRARVAVERAMLRYRQGRHREAKRLCLRAIELGETAGADAVVARALFIEDAIDLAEGSAPNPERLARCLELFERCGDLARQAAVLNLIGVHAYYDGRWGDAVSRYDEARRLHERIGDEWNAATNCFNIAEILVDQGRLDEAGPLAERALRVWRSSKMPLDVGFGAALVGRIRARSGRRAAALLLLEEAVAAFVASDEQVDALDTGLRIVETHVLGGAPEDALLRLEVVERALRETPPGSAGSGVLGQLSRLRGYAYGQLGRTLEAAAELTAGLELARRSGPHERALALAAWVWLTGDPASTRERDELFDQLGVVTTPEVPREAMRQAGPDADAESDETVELSTG